LTEIKVTLSWEQLDLVYNQSNALLAGAEWHSRQLNLRGALALAGVGVGLFTFGSADVIELVTADSASEDAETGSESDDQLTSDDDDTSSSSDNVDESAVKKRKVVRRSVGSSEDGGRAGLWHRPTRPWPRAPRF